MSGIRALERKAPTKPMKPGPIERVEHEYIRHGTLSLIANFEVATGRVLSPSIGPTRNEADFATHIENTIDTDPQGEWVFIVDRLNIHQSESLVRIIAGACEIDDELGINSKATGCALEPSATKDRGCAANHGSHNPSDYRGWSENTFKSYDTNP